jgi:hypothetical protein
MGLGTGICFQAPIIVVQNVLPQALIPQATACAQLFQSLGGSVFIAVSQTIFQIRLIDKVKRDVPDIDLAVILRTGASRIPNVVEDLGRKNAIDAVLNACTLGLRNTYYVSVMAAKYTFLESLFLQWRKIKEPDAKKSDEVHILEEAIEASMTSVGAQPETIQATDAIITMQQL